VLPHEIPVGFEVTRPEPVPERRTVTVSLISVKVAVTDLAPFMVTVQVLVPVQAPVQPVKWEPVAGTAVSVTLEP